MLLWTNTFDLQGKELDRFKICSTWNTLKAQCELWLKTRILEKCSPMKIGQMQVFKLLTFKLLPKHLWIKWIQVLYSHSFRGERKEKHHVMRPHHNNNEDLLTVPGVKQRLDCLYRSLIRLHLEGTSMKFWKMIVEGEINRIWSEGIAKSGWVEANTKKGFTLLEFCQWFANMCSPLQHTHIIQSS